MVFLHRPALRRLDVAGDHPRTHRGGPTACSPHPSAQSAPLQTDSGTASRPSRQQQCRAEAAALTGTTDCTPPHSHCFLTVYCTLLVQEMSPLSRDLSKHHQQPRTNLGTGVP
jgi:hypothetical protein